MRIIEKIIFLVLISHITGFSQIPFLKVVQNQKYGYIDTTGNVIIPCNFHTLASFSEGLAAARINGLYGYIDEKGDFVIKPQFEYATDFSEGYAQVFHQGSSFFIDKKGKMAIPSQGDQMGPFEFGVAHVMSKSGKTGLINRQGQFVVDTNKFFTISSFDQGVAIVTKYDRQARYNARYKYGVIDTSGKLIVPFDRYRDIEGFKHGLAKVSFKGGNKVGLIDRSGHLLMKIANADLYLEDLVPGNRIDLLMNRKGKTNGSPFYHAYADQNGKLIINNSDFEWGHSFSHHRAFVKKNDVWILIDTLGQQISQNEFDAVMDGVYHNGYTWVRQKDDQYWSVIDIEGMVVQETKSEYAERIPNSNLLIYEKYHEETDQMTWGLIDGSGKIITQALFQNYDRGGFQNGYLLILEDGHQKYINKAGKCIWMAKIEPNTCSINVDYMLRGHFYASSERHPNDPSGFAKSDNAPQAIQSQQDFPADLAILVRENQLSTEPCKQQLHISNRSGENQLFNAQDSRLYLKLQAKDLDGKWKDIEYLPSSWCGNSYHTLTLPNETYWTFPIPNFEGSFPTVLRAELRVIDPTDTSESGRKKKDYPIYSNEFQGKINPAQFWRKAGYSPSNIMDPYLE